MKWRISVFALALLGSLVNSSAQAIQLDCKIISFPGNISLADSKNVSIDVARGSDKIEGLLQGLNLIDGKKLDLHLWSSVFGELGSGALQPLNNITANISVYEADSKGKKKILGYTIAGCTDAALAAFSPAPICQPGRVAFDANIFLNTALDKISRAGIDIQRGLRNLRDSDLGSAPTFRDDELIYVNVRCTFPIIRN